jgi:hypothetical protein
VKIVSWARVLSGLIGESTTLTSRTTSVALRPSSRTTQRREKKADPRARRSPRSAKKQEYPLFFRRGEQLIRVAWSKRDKQEYQHKSSHSGLKALARAMAKVGADGRVFSTEDFLPIQHEDGSEIPNYQAYAGIALLKQGGLIDQHGRQGYSIANIADFPEAVEAIWKRLAEL